MAKQFEVGAVAISQNANVFLVLLSSRGHKTFIHYIYLSIYIVVHLGMEGAVASSHNIFDLFWGAHGVQ